MTGGSSSNCVRVGYNGRSYHWTNASYELCVPVCFRIDEA